MLSISVPVPDPLDSSGLIVKVLVEKPAVCVKAFQRMWPRRNPKCLSTNLDFCVNWKAPEPDFLIILVNFPYLVR